MTEREAVATWVVVSIAEVGLVRATGGPLDPTDLLLALVVWLAGSLTSLAVGPAWRPIVALGALAVLCVSILAPVTAATWGAPLAAALAGCTVSGIVIAYRAARLPGPWIAVAAIAYTVALSALASPPLRQGPALAVFGVALITGGSYAALRRPGVVLLAAIPLALVPFRLPRSDDRPDILVVTVDALRADTAASLSSFRTLRQRGRDLDAWAPAPWTLPSLASLWTGVPAHEHGAGRAEGGGFAAPDPRLPTVAEAARAEGYTTIAISAGNPFTGARYGLTRGFDETWHPWEPTRAPLPRMRSLFARPRPLAARLLPVSPSTDSADALVRQTLDRLAASDGPRFAWLHLMDLHLPWAHAVCRKEVLTRPGARAALLADPQWQEPDGVACLSDSYAATAQALDRALQRLLEGIDLERTLVVFTADHGEALGEVGVDHGHTLDPAVTRIPLVLSTPGTRPPQVSGSASLTDLAPTLAAWMGSPVTFPGTDLLSGEPVGPAVISNLLYGPDGAAVVDGPWRLVRGASGKRLERWRSPSPSEPPMLRSVVDRLDPLLPGARVQGQPIPTGPELEALGYLR